MKTFFSKSLIASSILLSGAVSAADLTVGITNLTHGQHFTPLLIAAHSGATHLFQAGQSAGASLQVLAECGDFSGLSSDLNTAGADKVENPASGLLAPGASVSTNFTTTAGNSYLSVVAMLLPTNDGFVGLNGIDIPAASGTYTYYLNAYDAGTEANSEVLDTSGCAAGMPGIPAAPGGDGGANGSGVAAGDSHSNVHIHRGVLGDTDVAGGNSDLNSTIHRWQNPVAKLVLTVN